jgi:hypothetical protein
MAEYISTRPKMMAMEEVETWVASAAPMSAPTVVAISRNMPIRILENPSRT